MTSRFPQVKILEVGGWERRVRHLAWRKSVAGTILNFQYHGEFTVADDDCDD